MVIFVKGILQVKIIKVYKFLFKQIGEKKGQYIYYYNVGWIVQS